MTHAEHPAMTPSLRTGFFAALSGSRSSKGTSTPAPKLLVLLAIALVALFATAASASAAPLAAKMGSISNVSYASAEASGEVDSPCTIAFCATSYSFQYATSESGPWNPGPGGTFFGVTTGTQTFTNKIEGLKGGTEYFVRLRAETSAVGAEPEVIDPAAPPYPSFTTLAVDPPILTATDNASEVFSTSAKATGKVKRPTNADPAFNVTACRFEYVTDEQFTTNPSGNEFAGAGQVPCAEVSAGAPITEPNEDKAVSAGLGCTNPVVDDPNGTCLKPGTTYHLRLVAENASPTVVTKDAANTFTTLPPVSKPTVLAANNATEPTFFSSKASGEIQRPAGNDPALDTSCRFEYVTDEQFTTNPPGDEFSGAGQAECVEAPAGAPLTTTDPTPVSAELSGLKSGTTFHLRLVARNGGGSDSKDALATFTTQAATPPTLAIDPPSGLGYAKVHLSGSVDPEGGNVDPSTSEPFPIFWQLQFSPADQPGNWQPAEAGTIAGAEAATMDPIAVAKDLEGLKLGTEYRYRLQASYADREALSSEGSFTTKAVAEPAIVLDPVTVFTDTTAKFTGSISANAPGPVDSEGEALYRTKWSLSCNPACPNLSGEAGGTVETGDGTKALSLDAIDLEPNTPYEVTLKASNAAGTQTVVRTFNTTLVLPEVKAALGASDGNAGYVLQGIVNPHNADVSDCHFVYGPTSEVDPKKYAFSTPCSPTPKGKNEVQAVSVVVVQDLGGNQFPPDSGQFRLSFRGQTTADLPFDATAAEVDAGLEALSTVGPNGVTVTRKISGYIGYEVAFEGSLAEAELPLIKGEDGTTPLHCRAELGGCFGVFSASTITRGGNNFPVTVEGHVTGLTADATYHSRLVVSNSLGTVVTPDQEFVPTRATKEPCPANEQLRVENSSLALPECRAYEMVTPPGKEGFGASFSIGQNAGSYDGGDRVAYLSQAGNIAKSGQGFTTNTYVAARTDAGWQTIPDLNGPSGSLYDAPHNVEGVPTEIAYSKDLLSSVWQMHRQGEFGANLRSPDGTFAFIGQIGGTNLLPLPVAASADLSHLLVWGWTATENYWGPGVYEFLGTSMDQPRRVDLDNSSTPISTCLGTGQAAGANAVFLSLSSDASTVVNLVFGGCGGSNPPADELWARVNGTTAVDVSASHCTRLDCNAPSNPTFQGAASDGSRVFFTTDQQLIDEDIDQTNDLYACDLPAGNPAPAAGKANPCSAFRQISVAEVGAAEVESIFATPPGNTGKIATGSYPGVSDDGSTVLFTAKGVLADNEDALGEKALAGDHNLYVWRATDDNPDGQIAFVARLDSNDLTPFSTLGGGPQFTSDGRYLVFTTASQLLDTDTDTARDVYRYDVDAEELTRVSTNVFGVAGNGDFHARIGGPLGRNPTTAISEDGSRIVFTTSEPLKLAVDNNDEPDVYLWTPARVSLISTGSSGFAPRDPFSNDIASPAAAITSSGEDIYFTTAAALTPADGDDATDIYDARVGGGFSFAPPSICTGEKCQPDLAPVPPPVDVDSDKPQVTPPTRKTCPKGKVLKKGRCSRKHKKHSGKKHHGKKASHKQGGGK